MTFSGEQAQRLRAFARRGGGSPLWHFLRGFLKHPVMVGSVIPSSKVLIDKMLEPVDWANCKLFVEYGPGVGTFTQHILDRLAPDATLLTIDTNPDFTAYLSAKIRDSRLRAVTGSAADVREIMADLGFEDADFILSGLPFSTLPPGVGPAIAEATADALAPGRRLPGLSILAQGAAVHRAPFRPDRSRFRMAQHPARHPVLGLEGLGSGLGLELGPLSKPKLSRREIR